MRKQQLEQLKKDNLNILKRLNGSESTYDATGWYHGREKQEKLLDSMCNYRHMWKQNKLRLSHDYTRQPSPSGKMANRSELDIT